MSQPHDVYDRWQRARAGRGRRASAPARFRAIGYRAGGPSPQPGPNPQSGPGAQPGPGVAPTPNPSPGPAPVASALPGGSSGPDLSISNLFSGAEAGVITAGQVVIGLLVMAVGLLLVIGETRAGAPLARNMRRAAVRLVVRR